MIMRMTGPPCAGRKPEPEEGPVSFPREALRPAPGGDVHRGNEARLGIDRSYSLALSTPCLLYTSDAADDWLVV